RERPVGGIAAIFGGGSTHAAKSPTTEPTRAPYLQECFAMSSGSSAQDRLPLALALSSRVRPLIAESLERVETSSLLARKLGRFILWRLLRCGGRGGPAGPMRARLSVGRSGGRGRTRNIGRGRRRDDACGLGRHRCCRRSGCRRDEVFVTRLDEEKVNG